MNGGGRNARSVGVGKVGRARRKSGEKGLPAQGRPTGLSRDRRGDLTIPPRGLSEGGAGVCPRSRRDSAAGDDPRSGRPSLALPVHLGGGEEVGCD